MDKNNEENKNNINQLKQPDITVIDENGNLNYIDIKTKIKSSLTDEDMVKHIYTYINGYVEKVISEKYNTDAIVEELTRIRRNEITHEQNDIKMDLNNLKDYRLVSKVGEILKEQGKSQTWLSEKTGIARGTMYTIVNNTNAVSAENALKIVKVLDMDFEEVFPLIKRD